MLLENCKMNSQTGTHLTTPPEQPNATSALPMEMLIQIFSFLDDADLQAALCVDRTWKAAALNTANLQANQKIAKVVKFAELLGENFTDSTQKQKFLFKHTPFDCSNLNEIKKSKQGREDEYIQQLLSILRDLNDEELNQLYIAIYDKLVAFDQEIEKGFFDTLFALVKSHKYYDHAFSQEGTIEEKNLSLPVSLDLTCQNRTIEDKLPGYFYRFGFETLLNRFLKLVLSQAMHMMSIEEANLMITYPGAVEELSKDVIKQTYAIQRELKDLIESPISKKRNLEEASS